MQKRSISKDLLITLYHTRSHILDIAFIMAHANAKLNERKEIITEEQSGIFQQSIKTSSSSPNEKRKDHEDNYVQSSNKYIRHSDETNSAAIQTNKSFLNVPFWKNLNRQQSSAYFQVNEVGYFSLISRTDDKQCYEDKRFLRRKYYLFI